MTLKWGIISVGKISTGFASALAILPECRHKMVAVAARDIARAEEFAKKYSIERAYGSYDDIANDTEVEVVYIGSIHPQHFEIAKKMLEHGKHVLCEKPMTMNEKQTRELIEIAKKCGKFLMEAVWSRCFPIYEELKKYIESGAIGEVKFVSVQFGMKLNHIDRLNQKELGGGTILDLGIYALQFQQFIFGLQQYTNFTATGHLNEWGTDESANAIITYSDGKTATLSTHACVELPNEAVVIGEKGTIRIPYFWRPTTMITPSGTTEILFPEKSNQNYRSGGMTYEADEVRNCLKKGLLESPKITHAETIQLAQMMDLWLAQMGINFKENK